MSNLNDLTKILVDDIFQVFNEKTIGEFSLPEYFGDENRLVYTQYPIDGFTLDLDLENSEDVENFEVDGELYYDDDLIYINITLNPTFDGSIVNELYGELIEIVRHELEHIIQYNNGMVETKEPEDPEMYYSQDKEIGAQRAGFKMKSEVMGVEYETLIREWFDKYQHRHSLNLDQKERVIQKILQ
jgi:hypothetical protein